MAGNPKNNQNNEQEIERRSNNGTVAMFCILILGGFGLLNALVGLDWLASGITWLTSLGMEDGSPGYISWEARVATFVGYTKVAVIGIATLVGYLSIRNNMS